MIEAFLVPSPYTRNFTKDRAVGSLRYVAPLDLDGVGRLAGVFPGGVTSVDGVPVTATVRVQVRALGNSADGFQVCEVQSAPDGTWEVTGLPMRFQYDVLGRKPGFNDLIVSDVTPATS